MDRGRTISELATECLRQGLQEPTKLQRPFRLPSVSAGPPLIDVTRREEIYRVLDLGRLRLYRGMKRSKNKD